jgi:adenylate cyclase
MSQNKTILANVPGLNLAFKFTAFLSLLIVLVLGGVGLYLYHRQSLDLGREVQERGATIARNLASGAGENINDALALAVLVNRSVQSDETERPTLSPALQSLSDQLPAVLQGLFMESFGKAAAPVKNEGVLAAVVVDTNGVIVAHNMGSQWVGTPYLPPPGLILQPGERFPWYTDNKRRRVYDISAPAVAKATGQAVGQVHLSLDRSLVDRTVRGATVKLIVVGLVGLIVGLIVAAMAAVWMVKPVGRLYKGVLAIAGGDFSQRLVVNSRDELGDLTTAFNEMAQTLQDKQTIEQAFDRYVSSDAKHEVLSDPSKAGLHGRRITATVYFSDIRGFTAMSETMQPEEVVAVINEYLSAQAVILTQAGGQVNKFVGDAAMAIFGMRESHPDDALRAVKSAVMVQAALKKMNEQRVKHGQVAKQIGIGINTGEMVVGNIGGAEKMEYTAMGEEVAFSDKLCAVCEGGSILISQSTYDLVKDHVEAKGLDPISLPGREEKVPVYQLISMKKK